MAARDHCLSLVRAVDRPTGAARYGRMFPGLEPLGTAPDVLMRAGGDGGICDAAPILDRLSRDGDDAAEAAGWPFFGQLIAHDITADRSSIIGGAGPEALSNARAPELTWHYQWIVVHDFLPRLVGASLVEQVLADGGRWFAPAPGQAFIPLEFADAAYRYGHGQIRHTYRLVDSGPAVPLFPDLVGFGPLPAGRRLDPAQIFDMPGHPPAQRAKRLDGRLAASLIGLPEQVTGAVDAAAYRSLAVRDLLRGESTALPSGEAVARLVGVAPLSADELEQAWPNGTPLWFYILKEAEHRGGGDRLGPVGGRIVTEVLIGLLRADPASYLSLEPEWEPTLPAAGARFGLTDLFTLRRTPVTTGGAVRS